MLSDWSEVTLLDGNLNREEAFTAPFAFTHPSYANTTGDSRAYDLLKATLEGSTVRTFH
jgi:hypothetical protein